MAAYVDTSALVKLVVAEPESAALQRWLQAFDAPVVSSDLARTELMRAVRRSAPDRVAQARAVMDAITLLRLTPELFEAAGRLEPDVLCSLDALHLAAALALGDDLHVLVTYDERLGSAAQLIGITVVAPA